MLHGPVFWGRTEPLVVGRTSSRGQSGPDLVSIYPYPAYGGPGPVTGGLGDDYGDIGNPSPDSQDQGGKRVKVCSKIRNQDVEYFHKQPFGRGGQSESERNKSAFSH